MTPQSLTIIQTQNGRPNTYIFSEILANDGICLSVSTNNATLANDGNRLALEAVDDSIIKIIYETDKIKRALWITILSWAGVFVFFASSGLRSIIFRVD